MYRCTDKHLSGGYCSGTYDLYIVLLVLDRVDEPQLFTIRYGLMQIHKIDAPCPHPFS